ncbi:unnamed protein product [Thelazia callipaeda]|uniref:Mediator of RNA polymerase II transcription subunit 16 n=1 Tax=Thelazia callipaeda TaxID=103827 RepID=A0A0N5CT57_THECL|nr:unnamed protein product [Thelazia callipaeda]
MFLARLEKGCQLFGTCIQNNLKHYLIVCTSKNITALRCNADSRQGISNISKLPNAFTSTQTVSLMEEITAISVVEGAFDGNTWHVAALTRSIIAIVNLITVTLNYPEWNLPKCLVIFPFSNYDSQTQETLLCHQNISVTTGITPDEPVSVEETFRSCPLNAFGKNTSITFNFPHRS